MDVSKLLESGKYSDLTISCHGREFKVHKAILCLQSEVIAKLCDIPMREKNTGIVEHQEFDDDTMERMINFAYKQKYEATRRPKWLASEGIQDLVEDTASLAVGDMASDESAAMPRDDSGVMPAAVEKTVKLSAPDLWVVHARVYGLADYYDMSELRDHAYECFVQVANNDTEVVKLDGFINVAGEVCKRTTRGSLLRTEFLSLVSAYAAKLAADHDFIAALCDPSLKDITVEIFCVLGQRTVELEERTVELEEEKKEITSSFQTEKESLQQSLSNLRKDKETVVNNARRAKDSAEGRLKDAESEMLELIASLMTLPASCIMRRCDNTFGKLLIEKGRNGKWEIRCGAGTCRCKLR